MPLPSTPTSDALRDLSAWLVQQGLEGAPFDSLLEGYCLRLCDTGVPLLRTHVTLRAHHPEFGSIAFRWHRDGGIEREHFGRVDSPRTDWRQSPLYYLLMHDIPDLHEPLPADGAPSRFPFLNELRTRGTTDYFAAKALFSTPTGTWAVDPDNTPEGLVMSWTTDAPGGFAAEHLDALRALIPSFSLALKDWSNRQMAQDLMATYLGADAGRRVLSGDIQRGSFETIRAVIWYFDLQGFTKLSEDLPGPDIIAMLNDYFGTVVSVVEAHGGNVLKFMGDGLLAIFSLDQTQGANRAAVAAAATLRDMFAGINQRRAADGLPQTGFNIALHSGDVLYGNIGGANRLDFTVIGPAVNTTARILGMCNLVDQNIVISAEVAKAAAAARDDLVSLGQYRLRGVKHRQELFTLD